MIVTVLNYHSSIITIMVKNDNVLCINCTIKTGTVREQVRNLLKRLLFSSRQAFLLSKTACKAAWDPGVPIIETRVRERCRPGSARSRSGNAEKFIRYTRGTFMPSFCILSSEKRHFYDKTPPFCQWLFCLCKHKQCIIIHINKHSSKKHDGRMEPSGTITLNFLFSQPYIWKKFTYFCEAISIL